MRRKDREITDINAILGIIDACEVCHFGLCSGNKPYIVPLNFGYTYENSRFIFYFHGAKEGKKLDIIRENPNAFIQMDCAHQLLVPDDPVACKYSYAYQSFAGEGIAEICGSEEKQKGLALLMKQYAAGHEFTFTKEQLDAVAVWKLTVNNFWAKGRAGMPAKPAEREQ